MSRKSKAAGVLAVLFTLSIFTTDYGSLAGYAGAMVWPATMGLLWLNWR